MYTKDEDLVDESEYKDQFDPFIEELDPESDSEVHPIQPSLPTDECGEVPQGLTIRIRRSAKGQEPRGLIFTAEEGPATGTETGESASAARQIMFAEPRNWVSNASREEVIFYRGGKRDGPAIGSVNFHHWLVDQSKAVIIKDDRGNEMDLRRTTAFKNQHGFVLGDQRYVWRRSKEAGGAFKFHFECVDEQERQLAHYMSEMRAPCRPGPDKRVGRFEVRQAGLRPEVVEALLMTQFALYVKMQKRVLQMSQAGNMGGLMAAVLYVVGG